MAFVVPVAPVRLIVAIEFGEIAIDRRCHLLFDDGSHGLATKRAITFAPLQAVSLHRLHHLELYW